MYGEDKRFMKRVLNLFILFIPLITSGAVCFFSPFLLQKICAESRFLELYRFILTSVFFIIPTLIIFLKTRGINPMIKINGSKKENSENEKKQL